MLSEGEMRPRRTEWLLGNWKQLWNKIIIYLRLPEELRLQNVIGDVCGNKNTKLMIKGCTHSSPWEDESLLARERLTSDIVHT